MAGEGTPESANVRPKAEYAERSGASRLWVTIPGFLALEGPGDSAASRLVDDEDLDVEVDAESELWGEALLRAAVDAMLFVHGFERKGKQEVP